MESIEKSTVKTIRVDTHTAAEIERLCRGRRTTFSALAGEMLTEAARMRRCPGIVFADGPSGRRARIEGTGIEVWELISSYRALDGDEQRFRAAYHWLSERQLLAAMGYYRAFSEEVEGLIQSNQEPLTDDAAGDLPFARQLRR